MLRKIMESGDRSGLLFGILMSYAMTVGMEFYNLCLKLEVGRPGGLALLFRALFPQGLLEMAGMGMVVFLFSNLWGNRCGAALSARGATPARRLRLRQLGTVCAMCPTMSLVAVLLFKVLADGQPLTRLPALWLSTLLKNLPMALVWSILVAAPLCRWLLRRLTSGRPA